MLPWASLKIERTYFDTAARVTPIFRANSLDERSAK
jgi:hypothetical protein